ncbi:MAG: hypothetical protein AAB263_02930 [Planctomycetota bacterium]
MALLEPVWTRDDGEVTSHGKRLEALRFCSAGLSEAARRLIDLHFQEGKAPGVDDRRIGAAENGVYFLVADPYADRPIVAETKRYFHCLADINMTRERDVAAVLFPLAMQIDEISSEHVLNGGGVITA